MFNRIPLLALSLALSSLSFGCHATAQQPLRTGSVEFVADASHDSGLGLVASGSFVINGLDSSLRTRISTPHDSDSAARVTLPAGVYAVSWDPEASPTGTWTTAAGLPRVIVVMADRATTVRIHTLETANPDA